MTLATHSSPSKVPVFSGIRPAEAHDEPDFLRLWRAMLEEIAQKGSDILPSPENMTEYLGYFRAYQRGQLFGTCLFWDGPSGIPESVTMAGELWSRNPFQSRYGRMATWWGTYLSPEYRGKGHDFHNGESEFVPFQMWVLQRSLLMKMGFRALETFFQQSAWNHSMEETLRSERNRSATVEGLVPGSVFKNDRQCIQLHQTWTFAEDDPECDDGQEDS